MNEHADQDEVDAKDHQAHRPVPLKGIEQKLDLGMKRARSKQRQEPRCVHQAIGVDQVHHRDQRDRCVYQPEERSEQ
jgi:hypothetical protein